MSREIHGAPPWRCLLVWVVATAVVATVLAVARGELQRSAAASLESLLAAGCAIVLAGCALWFWLVATAVIVGAARGWRTSFPGCPRRLSQALLVACGLAMLVPAAPVAAESDPAPRALDVLAGLPLPDRPEIRGPGSARPPSVTPVVVRPGDSLWEIAVRSLPPGTGPVEIDARWREIWSANRARIGADPDLIHPGAELRLPAEES